MVLPAIIGHWTLHQKVKGSNHVVAHVLKQGLYLLYLYLPKCINEHPVWCGCCFGTSTRSPVKKLTAGMLPRKWMCDVGVELNPNARANKMCGALQHMWENAAHTRIVGSIDIISLSLLFRHFLRISAFKSRHIPLNCTVPFQLLSNYAHLWKNTAFVIMYFLK